MTAAFNPYKIYITDHAAKRYAQRRLGYDFDRVPPELLGRCREMMRDDMMSVYTQHTLVCNGRREYKTSDYRVFVLTANNKKVITYEEKRRLSKPQIKKIRKQLTYR